MRLRPVSMDFNYGTSFGERSPSAYETLLIDVLAGDPTLFTRQDMVEASWQAVQPILDYRETHPPEFPNYPAGTWGPKAADEMLARRGQVFLSEEPAQPGVGGIDRLADRRGVGRAQFGALRFRHAFGEVQHRRI